MRRHSLFAGPDEAFDQARANSFLARVEVSMRMIFLTASLAVACALPVAPAHAAVSVEKIEFGVTSEFERGAAVAGEFRIPPGL